MPAKASKATRPAAGAFRVRDLAQVRVLANPLRLRLLEVFGRGPRTTKQVAQLLGEKPTRLYHHVEALARAGFLTLKETRPNRGTTEKYYESVSRLLEVDSSLFSCEPAEREAETITMARAVMDGGRTELLAFMRRGVPPARGLEPIVGRVAISASEDEMRKLRADIMGLIKRLGAKRGRGRGAARKSGSGAQRATRSRFALTLAFYPLQGEDEGV